MRAMHACMRIQHRMEACGEAQGAAGGQSPAAHVHQLLRTNFQS